MESTARRQTLGDIVRRSAKRTPHKPAILCGATQWTFAEFDAVCSRVAAGDCARDRAQIVIAGCLG